MQSVAFADGNTSAVTRPGDESVVIGWLPQGLRTVASMFRRKSSVQEDEGIQVDALLDETAMVDAHINNAPAALAPGVAPDLPTTAYTDNTVAMPSSQPPSAHTGNVLDDSIDGGHPGPAPPPLPAVAAGGREAAPAPTAARALPLPLPRTAQQQHAHRQPASQSFDDFDMATQPSPDEDLPVNSATVPTAAVVVVPPPVAAAAMVEPLAPPKPAAPARTRSRSHGQASATASATSGQRARRSASSKREAVAPASVVLEATTTREPPPPPQQQPAAAASDTLASPPGYTTLAEAQKATTTAASTAASSTNSVAIPGFVPITARELRKRKREASADPAASASAGAEPVPAPAKPAPPPVKPAAYMLVEHPEAEPATEPAAAPAPQVVAPPATAAAAAPPPPSPPPAAPPAPPAPPVVLPAAAPPAFKPVLPPSPPAAPSTSDMARAYVLQHYGLWRDDQELAAMMRRAAADIRAQRESQRKGVATTAVTAPTAAPPPARTPVAPAAVPRAVTPTGGGGAAASTGAGQQPVTKKRRVEIVTPGTQAQQAAAEAAARNTSGFDRPPPVPVRAGSLAPAPAPAPAPAGKHVQPATGRPLLSERNMNATAAPKASVDPMSAASKAAATAVQALRAVGIAGRTASASARAPAAAPTRPTTRVPKAADMEYDSSPFSNGPISPISAAQGTSPNLLGSAAVSPVHAAAAAAPGVDVDDALESTISRLRNTDLRGDENGGGARPFARPPPPKLVRPVNSAPRAAAAAAAVEAPAALTLPVHMPTSSAVSLTPSASPGAPLSYPSMAYSPAPYAAAAPPSPQSPQWYDLSVAVDPTTTYTMRAAPTATVQHVANQLMAAHFRPELLPVLLDAWGFELCVPQTGPTGPAASAALSVPALALSPGAAASNAVAVPPGTTIAEVHRMMGSPGYGTSGAEVRVQAPPVTLHLSARLRLL